MISIWNVTKLFLKVNDGSPEFHIMFTCLKKMANPFSLIIRNSGATGWGRFVGSTFETMALRHGDYYEWGVGWGVNDEILIQATSSENVWFLWMFFGSVGWGILHFIRFNLAFNVRFCSFTSAERVFFSFCLVFRLLKKRRVLSESRFYEIHWSTAPCMRV